MIADFLVKHQKENPVWFHMPGHKGEDIYRENGYGEFLDHFMNCDITEIAGADNLFVAEGIIRETMNRYKAMYGAEETYLLVNGSSSGLIAAIMTAVSKGGKLLMARNCHKSVFNGLYLAGGNPVYVYPETIDEYGISGEVTPEEVERVYKENPDAEALLITSPNYYGICSDIEEIAEIVHSYGGVLIVDQAHGAHLKFTDPDLEAENLGADIVINSTHKTLASFTQSAIVNICSKRIDKYVFEDKLQLMESTSPSYLLMASLDINSELLEKKGETLIAEWKENLAYFRSEAEKIPGLKVMNHPLLDDTKLNLDMSAYGIDGLMLEELLIKENIYIELVTGNILMCMTGIGNKRCDFDRLLEALKSIASSHKQQDVKKEELQDARVKKLVQKAIPEKKERVKLEESAGRICASSVIPYPPGIPLVCPGEVIDEEIVSYIKELINRNQKVMGVDDEGKIVVGK